MTPAEPDAAPTPPAADAAPPPEPTPMQMPAPMQMPGPMQMPPGRPETPPGQASAADAGLVGGGEDAGALVIVRAKDVVVGRAVFALVYADTISADEATIGTFVKETERRWESEEREGKIEQAELTGDVLYTRSLKAGSLQATEVHARELDMKKGPEGSGRGTGS